ncbi:zeatin O-glucosyltransferase [Amborella trichopoda]|nr:zeatin O-glucosyltransferase [Amborella trichopoda]|eukprot:XP_006854306.2 zeatin O-glucosyltransferase [Amborella trichopoda]
MNSPTHLNSLSAQHAPSGGVVVLVVPFPAASHLNQLLNFARVLAEHGLPVVFACSETHARQTTHRSGGFNCASNPNLRFHILPFPSFPALLPDPESSNKFPGHLQPLFDATEHLLSPLTTLVHELASIHRRVAVIHDALMSVAAGAAVECLNAEAYSYNCGSTCATICFQREAEGQQEPIVPGLPPPSFRGCVNDSFIDFLPRAVKFRHLDRGVFFNSFHAIEGQFLSRIASSHVWAIGPTVLLQKKPQEPPHKLHECMQWLDKQAPRSVLYVSFGTVVSMSAAEVRELAQGLEASGQPFLWVLRYADKGDIFAGREADSPRGLPDGYEERVQGRGLIVRDWAPQLEILHHPSTGGFLTHCGWNSCMESIAMGVPMVAWPMHSDQPVNAQLVTGVLGVGVAVGEWHERDDIVRAESVERAVRKLMASEEGAEMGRKAAELRDAAQQAVGEGGTSGAALDTFLALISRP